MKHLKNGDQKLWYFVIFRHIYEVVISSCELASLSIHPSIHPPAHLHGTTRLPLYEFLWTSTKICHENSSLVNRHLTWTPKYIYNIALNSSWNEKIFRENQNIHFAYTFFLKTVLFMRILSQMGLRWCNIVWCKKERGRETQFACQIIKPKIQTMNHNF